jgi:hypothetical protein
MPGYPNNEWEAVEQSSYVWKGVVGIIVGYVEAEKSWLEMIESDHSCEGICIDSGGEHTATRN